MLRLSNVRSGYRGVPVLGGVDLEVGQGHVVAIVGPNGHGKTTLLRTVSGLVPVSAGEVWFEGRRIDRDPPHRIASLGLVHAPQGDLPFADMTVEQNLLVGAFRRSAWSSRTHRLEEIYSLFPPLRERRRQRARTLSGGERRMLALGRSLMSSAKLLMIDEPALGLAPVVVQQVYEKIREIARAGTSILLAEESLSHLVSLAPQQVCLLEKGLVLRRGTVQELLADDEVIGTYLGGVR